MGPVGVVRSSQRLTNEPNAPERKNQWCSAERSVQTTVTAGGKNQQGTGPQAGWLTGPGSSGVCSSGVTGQRSVNTAKARKWYPTEPQQKINPGTGRMGLVVQSAEL